MSDLVHTNKLKSGVCPFTHTHTNTQSSLLFLQHHSIFYLHVLHANIYALHTNFALFHSLFHLVSREPCSNFGHDHTICVSIVFQRSVCFTYPILHNRPIPPFSPHLLAYVHVTPPPSLALSISISLSLHRSTFPPATARAHPRIRASKRTHARTRVLVVL